jgi:hypothetical protein
MSKRSCQGTNRVYKESKNSLRKNANKPIFGTIAKKAVTVVGDPSYISGDHKWKGAAEILKRKDISIKIVPITIPLLLR